MNEEIIDDEFYETEAVSPKTWWESRRWKYNKICLVFAAIILLLSIFIVKDNFSIIIYTSLFYWIIGNIAYTFSWLLENFLYRFTDFHFNENTLNFIFWFGIVITLTMPTLLISMLIETVINK